VWFVVDLFALLIAKRMRFRPFFLNILERRNLPTAKKNHAFYRVVFYAAWL
jgi:hypothetical protein